MVAGEASGDLLGGKLVRSLRKQNKQLTISGIGGNAMRTEGMQTLFDVSETSVVGIIEILKHYPKLRRILNTLKQHVAKTQPALLILIDYPEFNLKLAEYAKKQGIRVLFYVSPQVWAWRKGRAKKIRRCVDLMAVLFPFELDFYQQNKIAACLVRHPILSDIDKFDSTPSNSGQDKLRIGLLPGSRKSEIQRLFPIMQSAAKILYQNNKLLEFIVPIAPSINRTDLMKLRTADIPISFQEGNFYESISDCHVLAVASGTATLQAALMGKAMVITYKISPLTYHLFGHLVKVDHIGLANIILGKREFTELIQNDANAESLASELELLINDPRLEQRMLAIREKIRDKLNDGLNSDELAAQALTLASNN